MSLQIKPCVPFLLFFETKRKADAIVDGRGKKKKTFSA